MANNLLESCIEQHGESARAYVDTAVVLGGMCLLPNFGFDPSVHDVIRDVLQSQNPSWSGIRDIKVFAKASRCTEFDKNVIELSKLEEMFNLGKQLYSEEIAEMEVYDQFGDYWTTSDMYRGSKEFDINEFSSWMYEIFLYVPDELYDEEAEDDHKKSKVDRLIEIVSPRLFSSSKSTISMYCTTEDNNENTSFAPYFFIGDTCVVIIAKRWIL